MENSEASIRKDFLRFTAEEEASLRKLRPLFEAHVDGMVSAFYRHLMQFEETRRLLSDELITNRLLAAQRKYLLEMVGGDYGPEYQADRLKIGYVHERIGLTPVWYLGAYELYLAMILPLIHKEYRGRPAEFLSLFMAFRKVVFL